MSSRRATARIAPKTVGMISGMRVWTIEWRGRRGNCSADRSYESEEDAAIMARECGARRIEADRGAAGIVTLRVPTPSEQQHEDAEEEATNGAN